jgi:hypothetical protein
VTGAGEQQAWGNLPDCMHALAIDYCQLMIPSVPVGLPMYKCMSDVRRSTNRGAREVKSRSRLPPGTW